MPADPARRPRVLFMISRSVRGGAQVHVLGLLGAIGDRFVPALAAGEEGYLTAAARDLGVPVRVVPELGLHGRPWVAPLAVIRVAHAVRESGANLVSAHSTIAGLVGRAAARRAGVPAVFTAHGWPFARGVKRSRRPSPRRSRGWRRAGAGASSSCARRFVAWRCGVGSPRSRSSCWCGMESAMFLGARRPEPRGRRWS